MIILDFNMGKKSFNGIQTALKLREAGFEGIIILRTSDDYKSLERHHKNFNQLLENNQINSLLDKSDLHHSKEVLQEYLDLTVRA